MLSWFLDMLNKIGGQIMFFLPNSPFSDFINKLGSLPYLGYLNWFIPIGIFLDIFVSWLSAITVFYLVQAVLRWLKIVGN